MEPTEHQEVVTYRTLDGKRPFTSWLLGLRDQAGRAKIRARIARMQSGNFGDCKPVGTGVQELKIRWGPGYRVYFGREGARIVVLLCGGDKSTQNKDIRQAQKYWKEYQDAR